MRQWQESLTVKKRPSKAIDVNVEGTFNLAKEILTYENIHKKKIKLIHISSDAVYPSERGNYSEKSDLTPYNVYGWTKLASEFLVRFVDKHVIIRTRFFNKKKNQIQQIGQRYFYFKY